MTHAVSRFFRKEHCLVDVRGDSAATKMSRESAVTHQHDVVCVRLFFNARSAMRDGAEIVVNAHDWALVQRSKRNFCIANVCHKWYRTMPQRSPESANQ